MVAGSQGQGLLFWRDRNGWDQNPQGGKAEAEAHCTASAQAAFPARRARKKEGRKEVTGEVAQIRQQEDETVPETAALTASRKLLQEDGKKCEVQSLAFC